MSVSAQELILSFDALPNVAKVEVATAIMHRVKGFDFPPLTDDDLVSHAEALFLELDQRELPKESSLERVKDESSST
jgi:hypothetical protein